MTDFITYKPSDWNIKNLENIAKFITKGATPTTYGFEWVEESGDSIPFLRSECVTANGFKRKGMNFISKKAHAAMARSKIKSGDILMTITGNIGRIATLPDEIPEANINQHIAKISVIEGVSSSYVAQSLQQEHYTRYYERILTGQAYPQISLKQVRETPILLPSYPEQQKIAEVLSTVDKKIDLINQKIAETEKLKTGLMQKLFSEGVGVQDENGNWQPHAEFQDSPLGITIPSQWEVRQQQEVAIFYNGRAYKLSEWEESGTPVIRLQNLTGSGNKYYYSNLQLPEHQYANNGDLLFMWSATFGPKIWSGDKAIYHYHIWKVVVNECFLSQTFMFYNLSYMTEKMKKQTNGSTMLHFTKKGMEEQLMVLPPINEQNRIVEILEAVDKKLNLLEQQKAENQQLKKGLMQKLLTGEWRVPVEETEAT